MQITRGRIAGFVLLLAGIAAAAWSIMPRPVPVEVAVVKMDRFVATIDEDGKTRVRERYVVAAPLTGRLSRVQLKVGDNVRQGDAVATIVPSPAPLLDPRSRREAQERLGTAEAALDRAKALMERAKAQDVQADQDLTRTRTLVDRGAATSQALERAELLKRVSDRDVRASEYQLHAAEHELDQVRALIARYSDGDREFAEVWNVTAPVTGVVLKVAQESETVVQPGSSILEIGNAGDLEIVVDVLSTDAVEIHPGAEVIIERWGGTGALAGRVRRVEPAAFTKISTLGVEEQRVNVLIDIVSPQERWPGLGDAYQVNTKIVVFTQDEAIVVPAGALFRHAESWSVFVVEDGRARTRPVTLTRRSGQLAALSAGLVAGDRVVIYPSDRVSDGVWVAAKSY